MKEQIIDLIFNAADLAGLVIGGVLLLETLYQIGAI